MAIDTGLFAGMANARKTFAGLYFSQGSFITLLKAVKWIDKLYSNQQPAIVFEHKVIALRGQSFVQSAGAQSQPAEARVGVEVAHMIAKGNGKMAEMFLPNVKTHVGDLVELLTGANTTLFTDADWMRVIENACRPVGEKGFPPDQCQVLSGNFVGVTATQVVRGTPPKPFTNLRYDHIYSATELRGTLAALGQKEETCVPGGSLQAMIDAETAAAAASAA